MKRFAVILIQTNSPGNLGAFARAMANMDLSELRLVAPQTVANHPDAVERAVGAVPILKAAKIFDSIQAATADCDLIVGTTGRETTKRSLISPKGIVKIVKDKKYKKVALLFGNERNGLTKDQMFYCHRLLQIPSSEKTPSINISHAAAIVFYEFFLAFGKHNRLNQKMLWAKSKPKEELFDHLEEALLKINFLDKRNPKLTMTEIRAIFGRSDLTVRETSFLRGVCKKILVAAAKAGL